MIKHHFTTDKKSHSDGKPHFTPNKKSHYEGKTTLYP
jgi:hypothetical protein